jgi:hypothetical protein
VAPQAHALFLHAGALAAEAIALQHQGHVLDAAAF